MSRFGDDREATPGRGDRVLVVGLGLSVAAGLGIFYAEWVAGT